MNNDLNNQSLPEYLFVNYYLKNNRKLLIRIISNLRDFFNHYILRIHYTTIADGKNLSDFIKIQLETGDGKYFHNILFFIKKDFDKICSYNYHKYKNGKSGLKRLQIEKEDFVDECYLVFFRRLSNKNKSMARLADNPIAFLSNFIESRAIDLTRRKSPIVNDIKAKSGAIDSKNEMIEKGKSPFIGASRYKSPEDVLLSMDSQKRIFKAINQLPKKDREILDLRFMHGYKPRLIGEIIDLDINKVYDRIKQAKKKLEMNLKKLGIETNIDDSFPKDPKIKAVIKSENIELPEDFVY